MPNRLAPVNVATPLLFVVAVPTLAPFNVKAMMRPLTPTPFDVRVAERLTEPPYVPETAATVSVGTAGSGHTNAPRLRVQSDSVVAPRSICMSQIITFGNPALKRIHVGGL